MRCFSLFSGIGGFDLAMKNNIRIVGACEKDKYARKIYQQHFPNVPLWEDATTIRPEELPDFEMLCAGFPCQPFSVAGKRLGFEESRGTLFYEIARIAKQKRPQFLFLENVKGLLFHDRGKTFTTILATLDELGYDAEWQVINSKYFVPQNRERVFIIGHLREGSGSKIFPVGEIGKVDACTSGKTPKKRSRIWNQISGTIDAHYKAGGSRTMVYLSQKNANMKNRIQEKDESLCLTGNGNDFGLIVLHNDKHSTNRIYSVEGTARTLRANSGGKGSKTGLYAIPTLKATKDQGSAYTPLIKNNEMIRRLTPLECERLQAFPDGYTKDLSDTQRYKCLGNAVTVSVVEYIINEMKSVLKL